MEWISRFDLFLFDFDGLLVNTEDLHFEAYREMCRKRGFELPWNLSQFYLAAHLHSSGLKEGIYQILPQLMEQESNWEILYGEKTKIYEELLTAGKVSLLPGVQEILKALEALGKKRCVVTNSTKAQVDLVKDKIEILNTIPHWFTRESYRLPKPDPECYSNAVKLLASGFDRLIGLEDSVKGIKALQDAGISTRVLVCPQDHPQMKHFTEGYYFPSLNVVDFD